MDFTLEKLSTSEQVEKIANWLVEMPSVNGTSGEVKIVDEIAGFIKSFPYFKEHPDQVWCLDIEGDPLGRKNVFALIKGKQSSNKTVIFHSHIDTVDVKDFGQLEEHAFNPEKLLEFFKGWKGNDEIQEQAQSGDWLFGRGCLDMKSGFAVHLTNFLHFSERPNEFEGNILLMANPIEETSHGGIIAATDELVRLKKEESLDFVAAINNDYTSAFYPGDPNKYIYTGAVGKCLPSFYVYGRETHVGETLKGLDPTLVTAELNRLINNNMNLSEQVEGELVLPPCTLLHREIKDHYTVQTPIASYIYFNYMIYERSPKEITYQLKRIAEEASDTVRNHYEAQYEQFLRTNGFPDRTLSWDLAVYTFSEFCEKLTKQGLNVKKISANVFAENKGEDIRNVAFKLVDKLRTLDENMQPCIILFFGAPYVPYTYLKEKNEREKAVLKVIEEQADLVGKETGESFAIKRFFPYLSDSSYMSLVDVQDELNDLTDNFPEWDSLSMVPIDNLRELDIPSINLGTYGFDAHKWTERVYKPYTFDTLPRLTKQMTEAFLKL
ncbi:M20/M25/M40 family metallo-hydrolase [Terrilactibacillus laevilacticus]|uniref:M20/M25/M40 family metallo-hydrolase n=1 Tax=Terrilactibacillus laevilacticus TaxID=1380157 RepID=A0ABW5PMY5_9BACI|nr:M20/M25/M40 family metallo-hydrolase [Terrilactibacillus laevilacticus]